MKKNSTVKSLSTLVTLREREVDRLSADMAAKEVTRDRYQKNLARMDKLCTEAAVPVSTHTLVHAINSGDYRMAIMQMAEMHRQDLALHEADMALSRQQLQMAARRHEVLDQVLTRQQDGLMKAQASREQKQQDDLATQVWMRRLA